MEHLGDNTVPHTGSILLGTVHGSIRLITRLQQVWYQFLDIFYYLPSMALSG